jgi:hypothetical protein
MTASLKGGGIERAENTGRNGAKYRVTPPVSLATTGSEGDGLIAVTSGHNCWAAAKAVKSTVEASAVMELRSSSHLAQINLR